MVESVAAGCAIIVFICSAFNFIVIKPLKQLIVNLSKVVENIQRDLQIYNTQREDIERRVSILEVKVDKLGG